MKRLISLAGLLIMTLALTANVPAPYWPCQGKKAGDPCKWGYGCGSNGVCVVQKDCKKDPKSDVDRCIICKTK